MQEGEGITGLVRSTAERITPGSAALQAVREASLDRSYLSMGSRRLNSVHEFYRYPARFSPRFARAAIDAFTVPGDFVLDPFVGGGTTLVEARLAGRPAVGVDLNALAVFVSRAKTAVHDERDLDAVGKWGRKLTTCLNAGRITSLPQTWELAGYLRELGRYDTWRIRNLIAQAVSELWRLNRGYQEWLGRCAILRTAQWALDMRSEIPTVDEFRRALTSGVDAMVDVARDFSAAASVADVAHPSALDRTLVLHLGLPGLAGHKELAAHPAPRLILTSPPYPGVYVLYHRWKLQGRKEIPAPFWIAGCMDGRGQAYYTMSSRSRQTLDGYFDQLSGALADLGDVADKATWFVQLVGFNDVGEQLPRYLDVMDSAGFSEVRFSDLATDDDGRLWRDVPSRRWWVTAASRNDTAPHTAREVVLVHRRR